MTDALTSVTGEAETVRDVFDQLPIILCAVGGPEHVYIASNAALREFLGTRSLLGTGVRDAFPEIAGQQLFETLDRVYATGEPAVIPEWRFQIDLDGSGTIREIFFDMTMAPIRHPDGGIAGVSAMIVDATQRVRQRRVDQQRTAEAERRYQAARDVVAELQEALLPTSLPVLPGATLAARYLVAAHDQAAGGDWFDAVPLADGTIGVVVGDIVGHGVAASAAMGQLRAVLNRALVETGDVETAIGWVDRLAADDPVARAATVCVAVLDPATGALRYSTCGHPPPLVVAADGAAEYLERSGGGPLGMSSPIRVADAVLPPGATLLLFSDGLIEQPGRLLDERMTTLATVAGDAVANRALPIGAPASAPERACRQCVEIMTRGGIDDDVTMLAVQRRTGAVSPWQVERPATAEQMGPVRADVDEWLERAGAGAADRRALDLAVTELVANVVEHAYAEGAAGSFELRAALSADGVAELTIDDHGCWQDVGAPSATRGRGLWLAGALVDHLAVDRRMSGTAVTLRKRLAHPAQLAADPGTGTSSADRMEFTTNQVEGAPPVLYVAGSVDIATADRLAETLDRTTRGGVHPLTVDLNGVHVFASAGVRVLFRLVEQCAVHGHEVVLVAAEGTPAQQVLDLVGLPRQA